jgi:hypothetical protein
MRTPFRRLVLICLAALALAAGCGDDDDAGGPTSLAGAPTTTAASDPGSTAPRSTASSRSSTTATSLPTVTTPASVTTPAPSAETTTGATNASGDPAPNPVPVGEPPCEETALDAVAAPAEAHLWDDLLCVGGYAHAFLTFEDPAAMSPEFVFVAGGDQWIALASGPQLDGDPALAGVPPEALAAFQLVGPGGAGGDAQPPPPADGSPPPTAPAVAVPCDAAALAIAAGYDADVPLSAPVCVGDYARLQADVGDGLTVDSVFAAGPSGWRVLVSGFDLANDPTVLALPADVRRGLGF